MNIQHSIRLGGNFEQKKRILTTEHGILIQDLEAFLARVGGLFDCDADADTDDKSDTETDFGDDVNEREQDCLA